MEPITEPFPDFYKEIIRISYMMHVVKQTYTKLMLQPVVLKQVL